MRNQVIKTQKGTSTSVTISQINRATAGHVDFMAINMKMIVRFSSCRKQ